MQTLTIDVLNSKAIKLLYDLESLQLIYVHKKDANTDIMTPDWIVKYKGAMQKQSLDEINNQLDNLRSAWE